MEKLLPNIKLKANWPPDFVPDEIREFKEITKNFSDLLDRLIDPSNVINIYDNFGESGIGKATSRNLLKFLIKELESNKDFKGIYLFWLDSEPFYAGISRGVIKRIHQHIKGLNHFSSSLTYAMGKELHWETLELEHTGKRSELDFDRFSGPFKKILREQCQISMLPIKGSTELYLFEVYTAVQLKLHYYNKFKTH